MPKYKILVYFFICFYLVFQTNHSKAQDSIFNFTRADTLRGSLNPARSCYDVTYYFLNLKIDTASHQIAGSNQINFDVVEDCDSIQIDLFSQFDITGVGQGENWLRYRREEDHLIVYFLQKMLAGNTGTLTVHYKGKPKEAVHPPWDGGFIWSRDEDNHFWLTVACQGMGASSWWPCKDHLSDEPDSMRLIVMAPVGLQVVSNGTEEGVYKAETGYEAHVWAVHYPINTYNVTLNIGQYRHIHDTYLQGDGTELALDYYMLPYHEKQALTYFAEEVKPMLKCYEKYFGKYPFQKDGYALVETPYWGMEHQSAVAYGNYFRRNPYGFDFIIVHESGHEWWGNAVSCRDNAELWLHESFTTYSEALYVECRWGYAKALEYLDMQRDFIKNDLPVIGPMGVNYHNRPDNDIYYKGSWVLHTLRNVINNDSLWFNILYDFQQQYSMKTITTKDFIAHVNKYTGQSYDAFFEQYLKFTRPPRLVYSVKKPWFRTVITFRVDAEAEDFELPFVMDLGTIASRKIRLTATSKNQKIRLKGDIDSEEVRPVTELFYIQPVNEF